MGAFTRTALAESWTTVRSRALSGSRAGLRDAFAAAFELEWEHRRFFLWVPVLAGVGVLLFLAADHEPWLGLAGALTLGLAGFAAVLRRNRAGFMVAVALAAVMGGFTSAGVRSRAVSAPVLDRIRIDKLAGVVEEVDHRRAGSRFVLVLERAEGLDPAHRPTRVRLTTRRDDAFEAGDHVNVTARLLPPAQAALPGGYAFARDAYFLGIGAVGSVLGHVRAVPGGAAEPGWRLRFTAAVDRARNTLAGRVDGILGGDRGAIGAAMVTGKRDLLSEDGREVIREAGIFHIITIAGVQMTLVAGLLFGGVRRGLALSPTLALRYPVKKWAALVAIAGAVAYDVLTGSRVGTQRALFMTAIMLGAVLVDRRGFTMRNLALAALLVILVEPEALTGASFQLSFAAVAALVAVYEARQRRREAGPEAGPRDWFGRAVAHVRDLFVATVCATTATASFMAANFHELSPYVFVGNPLTLAVIEFFAVPGALLGCALYPLGLDGPVWHWVGAGIDLVLRAARLIGQAPASTVHLPAFAPWALPFLALAVLSVVLWRSRMFRLSAVPLAAIGLLGTALGPRYDLVVANSGTAVALRGTDGFLALAGKAGGFEAEQWLAADGDGREPKAGVGRAGRCDRLACVVPLPGGQILSLVTDARAFEEDCRRADVIVTRLYAPASCAAPLVLDKGSLTRTGALGLTLSNGGWLLDPTRSALEDRPWRPAPAPSPAPRIPRRPTPPSADADEPPAGDIDASDPPRP